jgi:uncharacterized membrane protein YkvA (DUF1232 family)
MLYFATRDPRTPWYARFFVGLVVAYALSPIDLIPDFIPVLGYLDEAILLPVAIWFALRLLPPAVAHDARLKAADHLLNKPRLLSGALLIIGAWIVMVTVAGVLIYRAWQ